MANVASKLCALSVPLFLAAAMGCAPVSSPSPEVYKSIQVVDTVDPRTVGIIGRVAVNVLVPEGSRDHARDYAIDQLRAQAMRQHPETTLLFNVHVAPGNASYSYEVSGVAAVGSAD